VALKVLPPEVAGSQERLIRFQREAESLAALEHPCIVAIHSVEQSDGLRFLTMEYVDGDPLSAVIPKQGLPIDRFFRLAVPLTDAVSVAHEKGVIHRDLKPSNIMVTRGGRVKVLDFGLSKLLPTERQHGPETEAPTEPLTGDGTRLGTLPYMSPEQVRGEEVDQRTDLFALGVVLYQMATGRYPFDRKSSAELASSILRDTPRSADARRSDLPHHLARIIRHCLEKDPEKRIQSAKDLRNELEDLENEISSVGDASGFVADPGPDARIRLTLIAAGLAIVAAGALTYLLVRDNRDPEAAPAGRPHYLAIELVDSFADNQTPAYLRGSLDQLLEQRLQGLREMYLARGPDSPQPDFVLEVDALQRKGSVNLYYRLVEAGSEETLASEVRKAGEDEIIGLVDDLGDAVAKLLQSRLGTPVRYRPPPQITSDPAALDRALEGLHLLESSSGEEDLVAAEEAFDAAVALDPDFALAHTLKGLALQKQFLTASDTSILSRAEEACTRAINSQPRLDIAHLCLGEVYRLAGRDIDAVGEYRQAIELGLRDEAVFYSAREAYVDLGRPESEERFWQEAISTDPRFWAGYYLLGWHYLDQGKHEASLEEHQRAIDLAPNTPHLYSGLFFVQYVLGRYGEAVDTLERSIELDPNDYTLRGNLGLVYFLLRHFDEAIESFEQAVAGGGDDYRAHAALGRALYWAPGRREESRPHLELAVEMCRQELAEDPSHADGWILLAGYEAMLGRTEESRTALSEALSRRPNDPHFFYLAGRIHNMLGEEDAALGYLERSIAGGYGTAELLTNIELDNLRNQPRFIALFKGN
jgi:tetratricopeptide (TPR) repeat protein